MKTIGFIGAYDKMDFILYVAKVLTTLNKKVLVVDSTNMRKSKIHSTYYNSYKIICYRV